MLPVNSKEKKIINLGLNRDKNEELQQVLGFGKCLLHLSAGSDGSDSLSEVGEGESRNGGSVEE